MPSWIQYVWIQFDGSDGGRVLSRFDSKRGTPQSWIQFTLLDGLRGVQTHLDSIGRAKCVFIGFCVFLFNLLLLVLDFSLILFCV